MIRLPFFQTALFPVIALALWSTSTNARAEALGFNDSSASTLVAGYDGFHNALQYDGVVAANDIDINFTKGMNLTFSGTFTTSGDLEDTATYAYVTAANPTQPLAILDFTLTTTVGNNGTITGTFIGYNNPNLPLTIPAGAVIEVATPDSSTPPVYGNVTFIGNLGFYTTLDTNAVPEPSTYAMVGGAAVLFGLARRRRQA